jgi:hypothetical protein
MSKSIPITVAIAAFLASAPLAGGALAQTDTAPAASAPAAPAADATADQKPKPKPKPMINVVVTNNRSIGLVELAAAPAGGPERKKILSKLAAGKKATVRIPKDKGCAYDLHVSYEDGTSADMSSVDLCKDGKINLVE